MISWLSLGTAEFFINTPSLRYVSGPIAGIVELLKNLKGLHGSIHTQPTQFLRELFRRLCWRFTGAVKATLLFLEFWPSRQALQLELQSFCSCSYRQLWQEAPLTNLTHRGPRGQHVGARLHAVQHMGARLPAGQHVGAQLHVG
jgi:hypothetical protein